MMSSATRTKLDSILATGSMSVSRRVLVVAPTWPTTGGDILNPPFPAGDTVTVPVIAEPVALYDESTYSNAVWTNVTALVSDYEVTNDSSQAIGHVRLRVPAEWASADVAAVFQEMHVLVIQERYSGHDGAGSALETDWEYRCFALVDGYTEVWDGGAHRYEVVCRDVLALASLDPLGSAAGSAAYQPDAIQEGTLASKVSLTYKGVASGAYEYYLESRGGYQQPNWADRPPPMLWCTNAKSATDDVRLTVAGNAVQVVYGEGLLRISTSYAMTDPGTELDYTLGLGITSGQPAVEGVVYRYAHPTLRGWDAEPDVVDTLTVAASAAGSIEVTGDYSAYPGKLTLIVLDGTGARYSTTGITYNAGTGRSTIALYESGVTLAAGTLVRYGDANRVRDFARRLLLQSGFQCDDSTEPFYFSEPETQSIAGATRDILLPPLVYDDTDSMPAVEALDDLRRRGSIPPNYISYATREGQVVTKSVAQLADGHSGILEISVPVPPAAIVRGNAETTTRVIARGLPRIVDDYVADNVSSITFTAVTGADGLPAPAVSLEKNDYLPSYTWLSEDWIQRKTNPRLRRLRGWAAHVSSDVTTRALAAQWNGAALLDIELPAAVSIAAIELDVSNPWILGFTAGRFDILEKYGLTRDPEYFNDSRDYIFKRPHRKGRLLPMCEPQSIAIFFEDQSSGQWMPLVSYVPSTMTFPEVLRYERREFDTRAAVTTDKLRVVCIEPCVLQTGTYDEDWWYAGLGVFLSRIKLYELDELRGVAALGETAPFNTASWMTARNRLRTRTFVLPDVATWANEQADVDALALEWLKEFARDYAVRTLQAVRPDVDLWDTVRVTLPGGSATNYLVTGCVHSSDDKVRLSLQNYEAY